MEQFEFLQDYLLTCPNSASSILSYQNDFQCKTGFYRIGYQCFEAPIEERENEGALFYSGFNHPYNIYHLLVTILLR